MTIVRYKIYSNIDNGIIDFKIKNNCEHKIEDHPFISKIEYIENNNIINVTLKKGICYNDEGVKESLNLFMSNICYNLSVDIYALNTILLFEFVGDNIIDNISKNEVRNISVQDNFEMQELVHVGKIILKNDFYKSIVKEQGELKKLYAVLNINNYLATQYVMIYDYIKQKIDTAIKNNVYVIDSKVKTNSVISQNPISLFLANENKENIQEYLCKYNDKNKRIDKFTYKRHSIAHDIFNNIDDYISNNSNICSKDILDLLDFAKCVFSKI